MARRGKIARLSKDIREQVNRRLEDGEQGETLLAWLNAVPEVAKLLAQDFKGAAITHQNLSDWRSRGFVEWQVQQETLAKARYLMEESFALKDATAERLTDHLSTVLAARYAAILTEWNGGVTEDLEAELRVLHQMSRDIGMLRRGDREEAKYVMELMRQVKACKAAKAHNAEYDQLRKQQDELMAAIQRDIQAIDAKNAALFQAVPG
jgi:hypothetical protein